MEHLEVVETSRQAPDVHAEWRTVTQEEK